MDWCDAYAYCVGVGKRLCGKIGGGANAHADYANASTSQWYNACVSGSAGYTYPYGNTYSAKTCNGYDYWGSGKYTTTPVGSFAGCQAPGATAYTGVYDLSGNVLEWEDSCDSIEQTANCRLRGGSFNGRSNELVCGFDINGYRNDAGVTFGFRCCAP